MSGVVSEVAGTTRDYVEEMLQHNDYLIQLVDTAGIKRKKKMKDVTSIFSLGRAEEAIANTDVIIILFDVIKGLQRDTRILFEFIE